MKKYVIVIMSFLFWFTKMSYAGVWEGGEKTVTALRFGSNGVFVQFTPAPTNCNGGAQYRMHVHLSKDHLNYNALLSGLLTLKTTKTPIQHLWVSNEGITCSATQILTLDSFEY